MGPLVPATMTARLSRGSWIDLNLEVSAESDRWLRMVGNVIKSIKVARSGWRVINESIVFASYNEMIRQIDVCPSADPGGWGRIFVDSEHVS